jgi:hypothetical protein
VAGGSAVDATKPGPWITWQETANNNGQDQIFVTRPLGPGQANCDGVKPAGIADDGGHVPAIGGFCFQQTGIARFGTDAADPSLNIDPTRNGVEPDISFTGTTNNVEDGVPWAVWYEKDNTDHAVSGLSHNNEMVFAAKGVADGLAADGGFHWVAVGSHDTATLDTTGSNHFGGCAASDTAEEQCSLNKDPNADAENPRVAAGTMKPANATVPWLTWDEKVNGINQVFVARLVGGTRFAIVNNGAPISTGSGDSTHPEITFSGNTAYVSWRENIGRGVETAFAGHFVNAANPTFVLDENDVPLTPSSEATVREPISSACTANPFNHDGQSCQGNALGTPFFLFTNGTSPRALFADAYQPGTPVTGAASGIGTTSATVTGSIDPLGASVNLSFQFGTTTAYGQTTPVQKTGPDNTVDQFSAPVNGLPTGATIHYRAVAVSDFGTFVGADQTLTTSSTPPPPPPPSPPGQAHISVGDAQVSGTTTSVRVNCIGPTGAICQVALKLTVTETRQGRRVIAITPREHIKAHRKALTIATKRVTLHAGETRTVRIALNRVGRKLLAARRHLKATIEISQRLPNRDTLTVSIQKVTFTAARKHHERNPPNQ